MMDSDHTEVNKDNVAWFGADKYYEILQQLILDMVDSTKNRDVYGMIDIYNEILLLTLPYIKNRILNIKNKKVENSFEALTNQELSTLQDMSEIDVEMGMVKSDASDFSQRNNNGHIRESIRLINTKKRILYDHIAKSGLFIPFVKIGEYRPAALAGDDF